MRCDQKVKKKKKKKKAALDFLKKFLHLKSK